MVINKKGLNRIITKITRVLRTEILERDPAAKISVTVENGDNIHILIISSLFNGLSFPQRDNVVWPRLENALEDNEIVHISLCLLLTPDEALVTA